MNFSPAVQHQPAQLSLWSGEHSARSEGAGGAAGPTPGHVLWNAPGALHAWGAGPGPSQAAPVQHHIMHNVGQQHEPNIGHQNRYSSFIRTVAVRPPDPGPAQLLPGNYSLGLSGAIAAREPPKNEGADDSVSGRSEETAGLNQNLASKSGDSRGMPRPAHQYSKHREHGGSSSQQSRQRQAGSSFHTDMSDPLSQLPPSSCSLPFQCADIQL